MLLHSLSVAPDSADQNWNPFVRVGQDGSGTLNVTSGGQLLLQGDASSTASHSRGTTLFIGGSSSATADDRDQQAAAQAPTAQPGAVAMVGMHMGLDGGIRVSPSSRSSAASRSTCSKTGSISTASRDAASASRQD